MEQHAGAGRIALIAESHVRLTGRALVPPGADVAETLWTSPAVVLAHGIEADPVFFYANRTALDLFELTAQEAIALPSRYSAESVERAERDRLFERVRADGYIDDYAGVRVSRTGKRFHIARATVWTLFDAAGAKHGEAATFAAWTPLAPTNLPGADSAGS